jgi:multicomponent Na+:H+ antiporter subunit D
MNPGVGLLLALAIPIACAGLIPLFASRPNVREAVSLTGAGALFATVLWLAAAVSAGDRPAIALFEIVPGIRFALAAEPLGALFACVAAGLWLVSAVYSIGYMRANAEAHQTRFYAFFALALASTIGVAFSANLFTLFVFYEALTLTTYPLVVHHGDDAARRAGRVYLGLLLGTSIGLFLIAIGWTFIVAGTLDFRAGGILDGRIGGTMAAVLLALYAFGIGKAALMPVHRWLPAAMVAPAPVSALLHAVAVVKAGVFALLKVAVYIFGLDFLSHTGASQWLAWVASASLLIASLVALRRDDLKARLAYSTVSQLAYVALGVGLASPAAALAGALQIPFHAFGKITLFFCAGAITTATGRTQVSQLGGLGRRMPMVFLAFLLGALSVAGLPPLAGMWVKWELMRGALDVGKPIFIAVLITSSLLNVGYLVSVVARGFAFPAPPADAIARPPPRLCVVPLALTALGCLVLFLYAGRIAAFLAPAFSGVGL